jgi:carboxyl-terminal processing protease
VARYYTPKGRSIQAEGITPDIKVEFAEPAEKGETQLTAREKDLEGHIKGDEEHGAAQGSIQAKGDLDAMKDNQLKSAIELLKSWEILRHIEKK